MQTLRGFNKQALIISVVLICLVVLTLSISYHYVVSVPEQARLERLDRQTKECKTLLADRFKKLGDASSHNDDPNQTLAYGRILGLLDENSKSIPLAKLMTDCLDDKLNWLP